MPKIVTTEQMRAIEKAADAKGHRYPAMMEQAGRAVAERVKQLVIGIPQPRIAILVGPGNNGGDGLVAGRVLKEELEDGTVGVFMLQPRDESDEVFVAARDAGLFLADVENDKPAYRVLQNLVANADVVVDALFGTSLRLPLKGDAAAVLKAAHKALTIRKTESPAPAYMTPADPDQDELRRAPVILAVDCPSGLDCDTGELDSHVLHATETMTFGAAKPGLFVFPGAEAVGVLHVADIGLPPKLKELEDIPLILVGAADAGSRLPERSRNSHKGTFGKAMIAAGSLNYIGAAYLAASSAYRAGAGLVTVAAPQIIIPTLAAMLPEATWILLPHNMGVVNEGAVRVLRQEIEGYSALLLGPGWGHEDVTGEFLRELLRPKEEIRHARAIGFVPLEAEAAASDAAAAKLPPIVIDADGLNLLADMKNWPDLVPTNTILTPHPGEFARLAKLTTDEIQANRVQMAQQGASEWQCVVVLKGAFTVVAAPDGQTALLPFATSALASAGTGDVLAGAITGLLAQGLEPFDAAVVGAWLHGMAGVRAEMMLGTAASVTATDVLALLHEAYALAEETR
ncbi:MAG TPA: NAD(P)H-hydrate dehydratase [Aggregatilineaceae bacterium]|nr:NAD(P)H-hydrate dehydratase [Aggregatilineaceae bacterium]